MHKRKLMSLANHTLDVSPDIIHEIERDTAEAFVGVLDALRINWRRDPNMKDTPNRVAKMFVEEVFAGRYTEFPKITTFPNTEKYDQLLTVGPIEIESTCSHHMMPFVGDCFIGILHGKDSKIIGLSKYARIVEHFAHRPQIQEELTKQILNFIVEKTEPQGAGVRIVAKHFCACVRGVKNRRMQMVTTQLHGTMFDGALKQEFLDECHRLYEGGK